ncbi:hypothetical protein ABZ934_00340 [Streptomyces sp. NPDC046557]|uniref:hypothetical protein n=1 Tax=Streptomyces sp. NPDC046557 TaxID=3155372 RepID=UPI0033F8D504
MSAPADSARTGRAVEEVLDRLADTGDREVCAAAEELVRVLMEFYGAGLARITARLEPAALTPLLDDELVSGLLALHDLHPEDVHTRIARALDTLADPVELLGFDETSGTLRLRAAASGGCGCGGTGDGVRQDAEAALATFAPEVTTVELEPAGAPPQPLLQIGTRPQAPVRVP